MANAGLPSIACGDFHRAEHVSSWKTLLPCEKTEVGVVAYLRSSRPAYITRLRAHPGARCLAAPFAFSVTSGLSAR